MNLALALQVIESNQEAETLAWNVCGSELIGLTHTSVALQTLPSWAHSAAQTAASGTDSHLVLVVSLLLWTGELRRGPVGSRISAAGTVMMPFRMA
jgi:hypothetical protein